MIFSRKGFLLLPVLLLGTLIFAENESVQGKVTEVTLYRGQAQVVRVIDLKAGKGALEVVVTNLPGQVVPSSLFAEGSWGVDVRAIRYRSRAVSQEPRKEVHEIDEKIEALNELLIVNRDGKQLVQRRLAYLDKLEAFVAPTAQAELSKGVLNVEALEKITLFSFKQREEAAQKLSKLNSEQSKLAKELTLLQRKRQKLSRNFTKVIHEAVLFLEKNGEGKETVRLTYLVNGCGWSPSYNFRADSEKNNVRVEYNAVIQQMSGENWENVQLSLSTASPSLSASGPGLSTFQVVLTKNRSNRRQGGRSVRDDLREIRRQQKQAYSANKAAISQEDNFSTSWAFNSAASNFQILELTCEPDALMTIRNESSSDGPSFSYPLKNTVSLASRSDQQMVRIMKAELKTKFYYVAIPILSEFVYREAELINSTNNDFLGGPLVVYLDNRFVGRTEITTVTRGQTFVVGFGAEPQLRGKRELIERKQSTQGGNQVSSFIYRLTIENYKDTKVPVRLLDRIPYTNSTNEISVALDEIKGSLSKDPYYLREERPKGILRWDFDVAAHQSGEKAQEIKYGYKMEFDRNFLLSNPSSGKIQELEQEFAEQQKRRLKR